MHLGIGRRQFMKRAAGAALGASMPGTLLGACGSSSQESAERFDPSRPWWLQGNFAPVYDELHATDLEVIGSIPAALDGRYVRNGSNPANGESSHWFLGDGMLHGIELSGGRARTYRNRWVATDQLGIGVQGIPGGGNNASNVSAIYHAGKLLTSGEVGLPFEVDPTDLSTVGVYDFDGKLTQSFTAHPKIDPATGYLHFFGYWFFGENLLLYHVADETGALISTERVAVDKATMIHSFAITEQDVVFWEAPVLFDLQAAAAGDPGPFTWDPSYGARIGVMPLGGPATSIRWVEVDPFYVFHEVNAYRDGDEVVVDVCWHPDMFNETDLVGGTDTSAVKRWRINTAGQQLTHAEEVVAPRAFELPSHDRRFSGRQHRHGWFAATRENPDTVDFAGIGHIDYQTGAVAEWDPGPTRHAGEAFFVAGDSGEAEGWLLSFVYDHSTQNSALVVLDAQEVAAGPIAEVVMPQRVPYGFHGVWIPS
jgi:carotenoid cleavage dioxygenase